MRIVNIVFGVVKATAIAVGSVATLVTGDPLAEDNDTSLEVVEGIMVAG